MVGLFQVGVGSGGMAVLDALWPDPRVTRVVLIDPDEFSADNLQRHLFDRSQIGRPKVDAARDWLRDRRPDLRVEKFAWNLLDPAHAAPLSALADACDLGVCAADNESAKFYFDFLMRRAAKPWTLGEVLSGGIGGFVHRFTPGGPCYGCVASHLQRNVVEAPPKSPDYSAPGGAAAETRVPAAKAAIAAVAGLHAVLTLDVLEGVDPGFTSLLVTLQRVSGVFDEAFRPYRFRVPRRADCLVCGGTARGPAAPEDLDVALDQAFARLGDE